MTFTSPFTIFVLFFSVTKTCYDFQIHEWCEAALKNNSFFFFKFWHWNPRKKKQKKYFLTLKFKSQFNLMLIIMLHLSNKQFNLKSFSLLLYKSSNILFFIQKVQSCNTWHLSCAWKPSCFGVHFLN